MSAAKSSARCSRRRTMESSHVSYRKKAGSDPLRRHGERRGPDRQGEGPEGRAAARAARRRRRPRWTRARSRSIRATRPSAPARMWGTCAHAGRQPDDRRHQGLRAQARDHRRRLSRRGAGQEPAARARLQPRRRLSDPGGHHDRDAEADRDRRSPASTSRRSARSPPRSATSGRPSPTRARA